MHAGDEDPHADGRALPESGAGRRPARARRACGGGECSPHREGERGDGGALAQRGNHRPSPRRLFISSLAGIGAVVRSLVLLGVLGEDERGP